MTRIQGRCPRGCGETLFLGDGGYVTCSWHACPDPAAAHALLLRADALLERLDDLTMAAYSEGADDGEAAIARAIQNALAEMVA